ncbi:zinc-binding dehydrogenase [Staphylococcus intermedius]|uniref:Sorbitol dehydrogenase n=1 Tax=Staphylococcus intermedius NCTC 11048 TaxID=1141106 RepID=A0A380G5Q4_STAIN|nr:zinc-binding dehydrogenase [Staphylococcus intermedius]PCF64021.1 sorbitol dehydrogenase [Staphylococcus intermedius]PCF78736.1 sorbitol dehydrogenase [Staphylococcus intermedius]PCF79709.1 sorbitol dehydrogenase [Staphylococcus intermedius]PCF85941.1 sorbitol dehydrogenase [Staphylococcus intermedius]PNZ50089.1 sorbitol dehydrogenase [Staphylococcus intermedius NCTC 11048]
MKALVKTELGYGHLEVLDRTEQKPLDQQVKIEVKYAGICGTDLHTFEGHYKVNAPVTLGHEFSGEIVEVGKDVTAFKVGDRVTSETTFYVCNECRYCKEKDYNLCNYRKGLGTQVDGGFAKYVIAREESVHRLPDNVSYQSAAMTEPLACAYHAVSKINVNVGDVAVVMGPGPIGLLVAQVLKSKGAIVVITGLDSDEKRLEKAKALKMDHVVNLQQSNLEEKVKAITDGYGADIVMECSGAVPAAKQGLSLLRKKGAYGQVGIFKTAEIPFDMEKVIQKELTIVGSRSQKPADWEPSLQLMSQGLVDAEALVTEEFYIDEWDKAYQHLKSGDGIKALLKPLS